MNMKVFEGHSFNEFRERVEGKDIEIASAIYEAIKKGYNRKAKQITAFNFKQKGSDDIYGFSLSREQWPLALNTCLEIYAEQELYEECINIKNIINGLSYDEDDKTRHNKKKRSKSV
jgi:hypothetical protein